MSSIKKLKLELERLLIGLTNNNTKSSYSLQMQLQIGNIRSLRHNALHRANLQ